MASPSAFTKTNSLSGCRRSCAMNSCVVMLHDNHFGDIAPVHEQTAAHQLSILPKISSRIFLTCASFSSFVPMTRDGSGKLQCNRFAGPGKIGQVSPLDSSQTLIT